MWRKQEEPKRSPASEAAVDSALGAPSSPISAVVMETAYGPNSQVTTQAITSPQAAPSNLVAEPRAASSRLTGSLTITGEITGKGDLLIDAKFEGRVHLGGGTVTVGTTGRVTANIEADQIVVAGHVKGNLRGRERVQVTSTGRTNGEIVSRRIIIEAGAEVDGPVEVTRVTEPSAHRAATGGQPAALRSAQPVQPLVGTPSAAA